MAFLLRYSLLGLLLITIAFPGNAQLAMDSTFNGLGNKIFSSNKGVAELAGMKVVTMPNGSIIIAGYHSTDSLTVIKLLPNGTVDLTFGSGGYGSMFVGSFQVAPMSIDLVIQRDGKIVVMACVQQISVPYNNTLSAIALMRLNANGSPDRSFNGSGLLIDRPDNAYQFNALAIAVDSTGAADKLYVSSLAIENGNANCPLGFGKWCICKYNTNGSYDQSFNGNGRILQSASYIGNNPSLNPMAQVLALKVLSSGKLLGAGAYSGVDSAFFMFRMNPDGSWDNTFANGGRAYMPWNIAWAGNAQVTSAHFLKDESVVLATNYDVYSNNNYDSSILYAVKFNADGTPATGFGSNGTLTASYATEGHHQISTDGQDRLILTWNVGNTASQYMHFKCFSSNGRPDLNFGLAGQSTMEPIAHDAVEYATVFNAVWTADSKNFIVLERRFSQNVAGHLGVFKYKTTTGTAATSVSQGVKMINAVYPIPAQDKLTIKMADARPATVFLTNAQGQLALAPMATSGNATTMDLALLARGIYYLTLLDASGVRETKQIILE